MAGGAEPSPWWDESHESILAAARAIEWPTRLVDLETQACRIVGDGFYERLNSRMTGLHPSQWLCALVEKTGVALRASVAGGTDDWQRLWALLCGLALITPPPDTESETAKLAREHFPDIKDPYEVALAEADVAASRLAGRGLASSIEYPADGCHATGEPLVAHDVYGSRFLLVAPFGYGKEAPDHWYAWDIDLCWIVTVVGAEVFGSARRTRWLNGGTPSDPPPSGRSCRPAHPKRPRSSCLPGDRSAVGHAAGKRATGTHPRALPVPAARACPRQF
jgi:hypothetical protein